MGSSNNELLTFIGRSWNLLRNATPSEILVGAVTILISSVVFLYFLLYTIAPEPRPPRESEKKYLTVLPDGKVSELSPLPCWYDTWLQRKRSRKALSGSLDELMEKPEVFMSVVVPAYNEEERMGGMLEEAVEVLQRLYGDAHGAEVESTTPSTTSIRRNSDPRARPNGQKPLPIGPLQGRGWEILIVSDGSTDGTVKTALDFARDHQLSQYPTPVPGPWKKNPGPTQIPHGSIRVIQLEKNRGKGGAVTHGMRHARGKYVVFADADGASVFDDLEKLVEGCRGVEDKNGRGVTVGSRAHLVGSEAVVKRTKLRNFLMYSFHTLLWMLTPRQTSKIKDTQCGFKLFSRPALPYIIPYMHSDGWIFDVEMLMLAEFAQIPVKEIAVGWKEVMGSKLNVVWASIEMAVGLLILRLAWGLGVYSRR